MNGAERICETLVDLGAEIVFGLPGSQNVVLYEALRRSRLRCVSASDEGAAAFMATGYARASGRVGVLTTIPGPGFLYALSGIAEAREDSAPVLWLTLRPTADEQAFPLQRIDQPAIARALVKRSYFIHRADDLASQLREAWHQALSDEPGPVLIEIAASLLLSAAPATPASQDESSALNETPPQLIARLRNSARPVLLVGQGAQGAAEAVRVLVQRWSVPVLSTCSGRGVLTDSDPHALVADFSQGLPTWVEDLLHTADLIVAIGCKLTHNGSAGGRLALPTEKLVRVDTSATVLAANYPAHWSVCARAEDFVAALLDAQLPASQWTVGEITQLKEQSEGCRWQSIEYEPTIEAPTLTTAQALFAAIADFFGDDIVYTTDAGLHQALVRRYARVSRTRGLLCPADFQSMGFGLPGAIGAARAFPGSKVIACVGDGALTLSLGDLLTAAQEEIDLVVLVFNDGAYGLIQHQQLRTFGHEYATTLLSPNYSALAAAIGAVYFSLAENDAAALQAAASTPGLRLVEARLNLPGGLRRRAAQRAVTERIAQRLPPSAIHWAKRVLRRTR